MSSPESAADKVKRRFNVLSNTTVSAANQMPDLGEALGELLLEATAKDKEIVRLNAALDEAAKLVKKEG